MCLKATTEKKCDDCGKETVDKVLLATCPELKKIKEDCTDADVGLCGTLKEGRTVVRYTCDGCKDKANEAARSKK